MLSNWKDSYIAYEDLQSRWPSEGLLLLKNLVYSPESKEYWLQRASPEHLDPGLLAEAERIGSIFADAMSRSHDVRKPFDDVYHAAIYVAREPHIWSDPRFAYRAQRDRKWSMVPTLFRPPKDESELMADEFNRRLSKLAAYSEALNSQYHGRFDEHQRIAIGQHYGLKTWLLDLTSDPWVALFFASNHGKDDDVGMVTRFSTIEWDQMSAGGKNRLGAMGLVKVPGIPRIEVQKALFLNGSHPDLIGQYGGQQLFFTQRAGLVFESEYRHVTKKELLADDEAFATFTETWLGVEPPPQSRPLSVRPLESATRPLRSADYRDILQTLIEKQQMTHRVTPDVDKLLHLLCDFHLELQNPAYATQYGSMHLLIDAAGSALDNQKFETIAADLYSKHIEPEMLQQVLGKLRLSDGNSSLDEPHGRNAI